MNPLVEAISDDRAREVAREVAARAEYARFAVPDRSVMLRLLSELQDLLGWMGDLYEHSLWLWLLIMFGLLAVAALLLGHVVWTLRVALRASRLAADPAPAAERRNLAREAEGLAGAGLYLDAAHTLHLACIERLVGRGVLELRRHDPNATLRERMAAARLGELERGEFLRLLDWLEGRWFRDRAPEPRDAELFAAWRTLHARMAAGAA